MKCKWCGQEFPSKHDCPSAPVDVKYEAAGYLESMHSAANAGGRHYVMVEPIRSIVRGPLVRLTLAKAGDTLFTDSILDHQELEVSEGGLGYLNLKYGYLGIFETFDDLSTAQARYAQVLKEVMAYRKPSDAEK